MKVILLVHLLCVGAWIGCVLTEALFERALLGRGEDAERWLAQLHVKVDVLIEIPAFTGVLLTGLVMAQQTVLTGLLQFKIALGLLAMVANLYCVFLVFRRAQAARAGHWQQFQQLDKRQHRWGAVVFLALLGALLAGMVC